MLIWWPDINLKTYFCHVKRQICARGSVYTTSVWYKDRERTKAGLIWASCLKTRLLDINPSFFTTDVNDSHSLCCWCRKSSVLQKSALSPWRQQIINIPATGWFFPLYSNAIKWIKLQWDTVLLSPPSASCMGKVKVWKAQRDTPTRHSSLLRSVCASQILR